RDRLPAVQKVPSLSLFPHLFPPLSDIENYTIFCFFPLTFFHIFNKKVRNIPPDTCYNKENNK
ncbi:hypothetical protein PNU58_08670, partial [[Ruminococcus] gnavus]|uniref:hypothetical protein n=1 Tax=Mediterraneibacter gnavus TaxID=33038 RepID=UPI00232D1692